MELKIDTLRTTTNLKNILSRIKGVTGIQHWNVLCRWGLSLSLKQKTLPRLVDEKLDGVEIDFDVFVGKNKNIYTQLLINNLRKNKIEINRDNAYKYMIAHVNRGINIIYNKKLKNISDLFEFN